MGEDPFVYYGTDQSKNEEQRKTLKDLDPEYTSYPVKVQALNIEWIVQPEGKSFLLNILKSGNVDLYQVPYIQIVIAFLYKEHRIKILNKVVPMYMIQVLSFFLMIFVNEYQFTYSSEPDA